LAADQRASTPSNAAELLVPDKLVEQKRLENVSLQMGQHLSRLVTDWQNNLKTSANELEHVISQYLKKYANDLSFKQNIMAALNPEAILRRGYAIVRKSGVLVRSAKQINKAQLLDIQLQDGKFGARVE